MKVWGYKARIIAIASFLCLSPAVGGAEFPEKPIQVLVGWPAGSQNDMTDRAIAQVLQKILKQPVIIQNVPGGGGALVLGKIKLVNADGYTLFQTGTTMYTLTPHTRSVPYDSFKDFAYLAQHASFQPILEVRGDGPWKSYEELIAYVKENPKKLKYTTTGIGGSYHLMMEYLAMHEKLQWIHVPFAGGTECIAALLGGHVDALAIAFQTELEHIRTGRIRVLLSLSPKRVTLFPDVPTALEKGYDYAIRPGGCWTVPAGTPKNIQQKLESALLQAFQDQMVIGVLNKWGWAIDTPDSEALTKIIAKDYKISGELMKKFGLGIYKKE